MEGHFIAFCKYFDGCSWHIYNDAIVRNISEKEINRGTPYILFYQNQNLYSKKRAFLPIKMIKCAN